MENKKGKVWLVGAGPGDAGLFTLKGKNLLGKADVVVYDKLIGQGILAMIPQHTERIFVGKQAGNHPVPQHEINAILLQEAQKGKNVVRLKGGDPFVFGRGGEELELLIEADIPFEIVPGITSAVAVPAYNGIPVTHREFVSSLHIITGHTKKNPEADIDYEALVRLSGTLVFLMGVTAMPKICAALVEAGMSPDMPAAILERGTTAHQRRVVATVGTLPEQAVQAGIQTPAIIIVGQVCGLETSFAWAEKRPLGGLKIAVTRPKDRDSYLADQLAFLGAEVVLLPTIRTEPIGDNKALEQAIEEISSYGWAAFTSPVGVEVFFDKLQEMRRDVRSLGDLRFAAIGSATKAAIEKRGILVDLMPENYSGKALGQLLGEQVEKQQAETGKDCRILIPRAKIGTNEVIAPIADRRLNYLDLPVYDTVATCSCEPLQQDLDYAAFTSASTVQGFVALYGQNSLPQVTAICIGESTAKEAAGYGMKTIVSEKATMDSMVDCLLRYV